MTRKDIKNGTILIIAVCVVAFIIISILQTCRMRKISDSLENKENANLTAWSDTLTNKASDIPVLGPMDAEIQRFMQRWELKGVSFAVMRHDSLLYTKGYGWADLEANRPMEAGTILRIASVSKLITATAIMRLIEQGKLSINSRVFGPGGILNDTAFTNAIRDPRMTDISVDHLLRHKGGFTLGAGDPMFNTKDIMKVKHLTTPPDNHKLTCIVLGRRLGFAPGSGRKYSNFGYMLLSLIIEKVSGKSYWDYVQENVLLPAGISNFRPATNYYAERHQNESRYYPADGELFEEFNGSGRLVTSVYGKSNVNGLMGAGGWTGTAAGLARLVAAIDGEPGVKDIISPQSVAAMTAFDRNDKLCRGWGTVTEDGRWDRTGTLGSTHALVERFPEGDCWVIVTNSGVWTGHRFSAELKRLIERLRQRHSADLPRRNLWK